MGKQGQLELPPGLAAAGQESLAPGFASLLPPGAAEQTQCQALGWLTSAKGRALPLGSAKVL